MEMLAGQMRQFRERGASSRGSRFSSVVNWGNIPHLNVTMRLVELTI